MAVRRNIRTDVKFNIDKHSNKVSYRFYDYQEAIDILPFTRTTSFRKSQLENRCVDAPV